MTATVIRADTRCLPLADDSVDLIVTSPPYAQQRKATYGGIPASEYASWFLPIADEMRRILKPTGSFVLNIKEHAPGGGRETYVYELILALAKAGWTWVDEYAWVKSNPKPGLWPDRFKDAWERCFHLSKGGRIQFHREAVMVPSHAPARVGTVQRVNRHVDARATRKKVPPLKPYPALCLPSNVLTFATESAVKGHPAAFPVALPDWFIRLFTVAGDTVLDPFAGSGTTGVAAINLNRHFIGIESHPPYVAIARRRIAEAAAQPRLAGVA